MVNKQQKVTEYQERVYAALQQIPEGRITTYAALSKALNSSPRAVGGALRNNPFAPEIPCHRCIASTGVCPALPEIGVPSLTNTVRWRIQGRLERRAKRTKPGIEASAAKRRRRPLQ